VLARAFKFKSWQVIEGMQFGWNEKNVIIPLLQNSQLSEIRWAKLHGNNYIDHQDS